MGTFRAKHFNIISTRQVLREPVARVVSNFFWRYRLYFNGGHAAGEGTAKQRARLKPGQKPDFGGFVDDHIDLYVRTLSGGGSTEPDSPTGALAEADLETAKRTLGQVCGGWGLEFWGTPTRAPHLYAHPHPRFRPRLCPEPSPRLRLRPRPRPCSPFDPTLSSRLY